MNSGVLTTVQGTSSHMDAPDTPNSQLPTPDARRPTPDARRPTPDAPNAPIFVYRAVTLPPRRVTAYDKKSLLETLEFLIYKRSEHPYNPVNRIYLVGIMIS